MTPPFYFSGPASSQKTSAFAHGNGVGMDSDFMNLVAEQLGAAGIQVVRFEFPYVQRTRADGKRRPTDRATVLLETWGAVIAHLAARTS